METIVVLILIFFGGWIIRSIFGGAKATIKTVAGHGSFSDNLKNEVIGMGDLSFEVKKETRTVENKSSDLFVMNFRGLFPVNITGREISFIFNIFDVTKEGRGPIVCPIAGFNEGNSVTFQYLENKLPPLQEGYGWKSWVELGIAPIEFLKFPHKGNLKLEFQCCISLKGNEPKFNYGGTSDQSKILAVYKYKLDFNNTKTGYTEISAERIHVEKAIISLGFYIAAVDGSLDINEGNIIKEWVKEQINSAQTNQKEEIKKRLNENIIESVKKAKSQDLSLSKIIENLNKSAEKTEKYEALELAIKVMEADGMADQKELETLDNIAIKIKIDPASYKSLRDKSISKVDFKAVKKDSVKNINEASRKKELANILSLNDLQNKALVKKQLTKEFARWNDRVRNNDIKVQKKAKEMLNLIAEARLLFIDE